MSEINVLVSGNVTPQVKGGTLPKEENPGTDSAAMEFAAIFGGWMAQAMGQGQNSGFQSSDPAGKEANSGQTGIQGLEGTLGMLRTVAGLNGQSSSGQEQQGLDSMLKSTRPEIMTLLSQDNLFGDVTDSGIGSGQLQTVKLPLSELDQYRVLITQLLQDMSGEISKVSVKPAEIQGLLSQLSKELNLTASTTQVDQSNFVGTKPNVLSALAQLSQEVSLSASTTQVDQSNFVSAKPNITSTSVQLSPNTPTQDTDQLQIQSQSKNTQLQANLSNESQTQIASVAQSLKSNESMIGLPNKPSGQVTNTVQNANLNNTTTGLQSLPKDLAVDLNSTSEKVAVQTMPFNRNLTQTLKSPQDMLLSQTQNGAQPDELSTENHLLQMKILTETGRNGARKEEPNLSGNGNMTSFKDAGAEGINSNLGDFNLANLTLKSTTEVGNKIAASPNVPIWQQVAQELQAKVLNQLPNVRELNIQLHPAELGQISISVTLNNGQVHLQMIASEAATGQILQNNFPQLRESLSQSGIQCGMMQMGFADSNPNFSQGRNQTFAYSTKKQAEHEIEDNMMIEETLGVGSNRINVTA